MLDSSGVSPLPDSSCGADSSPSDSPSTVSSDSSTISSWVCGVSEDPSWFSSGDCSEVTSIVDGSDSVETTWFPSSFTKIASSVTSLPI